MSESKSDKKVDVADIVMRMLILLLFIVSLPKILYLISIYQWGIIGMITVYAIFFFACYMVAYRKEEAVMTKIINIANKINPKKKIGVCH